MAKEKYIYVCSECGATSPRWLGRCPECQSWNTLFAEVSTTVTLAKAAVNAKRATPLPISAVENEQEARFTLQIAEMDAILGGGLVPGSLVLLGGEPGIGKSTLLLQVAKKMAETYGKVLYVSGEESAKQIKLRADRLHANAGNIMLLAECNMDHIMAAIEAEPYQMIILDSIQSVYKPDLPAAPGSVSQVRQCAAQLLEYIKSKNIPTFLVGHVTKEGSLAGPRILEHMVDTVLYFEGERIQSFRLLRAVKNRFGSTNEIAVFSMEQEGLVPYADPSRLFLSQREKPEAGTAVTGIMQGSRPVLLEVQALTTATSFGNPRRLANGFDYNRLLLVLAILEKKLGLKLGTQDVYLNMAGGLRVEDPAADLAAAAAVVSSYKEKTVLEHVFITGEIGLTGEVRPVGQLPKRLKEAANFGFTEAIVPKSNGLKQKDYTIKLRQVSEIEEAFIYLGLC